MNIASYATGLQHIGIPTRNMDGTIAFYRGIGFTLVYETRNGDSRVAFLELARLVIEIWEDVARRTNRLDRPYCH